MKRRFRFGLRSQLVLAMLTCIVATVGVTMVLSQAIVTWYEAEFVRGLSPAALKASAEVDNFTLPNDRDAARELLARAKDIDDDLTLINLFLLAMIAAISILLTSIVAVFLASRIGKPLDAVSLAATQVAGGDLSARADVGEGGSGETARLIENFNVMAAALERFERQSVESSAAIAHELRTPLTILRGRLQGMLDGIFGRDGRDIETLITQVDSLTQIVNDLNIVSLAKAGRLAVNQERVDLADEVDRLLSLVEPSLTAAGFDVTCELQACAVFADPNRIRQATLALVENARVHASSGRAIHVETRSENGIAIIAVSDRGAGLPIGDAALLFEPFWRSDTSRNRRGGGSGLGLSVVAAIIEAHGGSIHALARDGGGAIFELRLPS